MKWIRFSQAAPILSVSVRTMHRWTKLQKPPLPVRKFGGQWRINVEAAQ